MNHFSQQFRRAPCWGWVALVVFLGLVENARGGPLTQGALRELELSCVQDSSFKRTQAALNQEAEEREAGCPGSESDLRFSNRLRPESATNQGETGRCWMFSALNLFRREAADRLKLGDFEFSENFLFFYDKLEKANLFLESIEASRQLPWNDRLVEFLLRKPVPDSGNWQGFSELVKKYGVVPKAIMPETRNSSNSEQVNEVLGLRLKAAALDLRRSENAREREALRSQAMKDVYRILCLNFGPPPNRFTWPTEADQNSSVEPRTYTPSQFRDLVIRDRLDDYVALYAVPTLPIGKHYEIELNKAVCDAPALHFVNCPLDTLRALAKACLLENRPVWIGCAFSQEVSVAQGLMKPGVSNYEKTYGMKLQMGREELFRTYVSTPEHNMALIGVDLEEGVPVKWLAENSRGERHGRQGCLVMTDEWFSLYVQMIVVPKRFVPQALLKAFDTKPDTLPPWDPMS